MAHTEIATVIGAGDGLARQKPALRPATICVDLEDALLKADIEFEIVQQFIKQHRRQVWRLPLWLMAGRATLGRRLAESVAVKTDGLPVREALLARLAADRASGRQLVLVSSLHQAIAEQIAERFSVFDQVIGSTDEAYLSSRDKVAMLAGRFEGGFEYIGKEGLGDAGSPGFSHDAAAGENGSLELASQRSVRAWVSALRVHQWAKNLLVFIPIFLDGPDFSAAEMAAAGLAFAMLSCFASAGYLLNDILDVEADRQSGQAKRGRAFASGRLKIRYGLLAMPLLVAVACLAASFLPPTAIALGVGYFLASAAYSIWLKREPMLDIVLLACLFTARIVIGIFAADLVISFWLLTFSMFFFLNLAIVKRYAELLDISREGPGALKRRGYSSADLPLLLGMGSGSAVASASIFVSYLLTEQFPRNIYSTPAFLWLIFPLLLYWMLRVWHLTVHGRMNYDPVLFALRDRVSQLLGLIVLLCLGLAW